MKTIQQRANEWILSDDTGVSSKRIWAEMQGIDYCKKWGSGYPSDPSDFGRCYRLLNLIPEWKENFLKHDFKCKIWKLYIENWEELERFWKHESPSGNCPQLYAEMQYLQRKGRK